MLPPYSLSYPLSTGIGGVPLASPPLSTGIGEIPIVPPLRGPVHGVGGSGQANGARGGVQVSSSVAVWCSFFSMAVWTFLRMVA
jgi:hypothetical protein